VATGINGPKILVGHSCRGMVISQPASQPASQPVSQSAGIAPYVEALFSTAAYIPQPGESFGQLTTQFPGSLLGPDTLDIVPNGTRADVYVKQDSFRTVFTADPAQADAAAGAGRRPRLPTS
jgi:hypothetical protein